MDNSLLLMQLIKNGDLGGSSSNVQIVDSRPFYNLFVAITYEGDFNGFNELNDGRFRTIVDTNDEGGYVFSSDDEVYKIFAELYSKASDALYNNPNSPAEIDLNMKVICNNYQLYGYELSGPIILDDFKILQYYTGRNSRYHFDNGISCHIHFLSNYNPGGFSGVLDGVLTFGTIQNEEGPSTEYFILDTNLGVFNLIYNPVEL